MHKHHSYTHSFPHWQCQKIQIRISSINRNGKRKIFRVLMWSFLVLTLRHATTTHQYHINVRRTEEGHEQKKNRKKKKKYISKEWKHEQKCIENMEKNCEKDFRFCDRGAHDRTWTQCNTFPAASSAMVDMCASTAWWLDASDLCVYYADALCAAAGYKICHINVLLACSIVPLLSKQTGHTHRKKKQTKKPSRERHSSTCRNVRMAKWENQTDTERIFTEMHNAHSTATKPRCVCMQRQPSTNNISSSSKKKRKKLLIYTNLLPIDRSRDAPSSGLAASPPIPPPPGIFLMRPPLPHIRRRWIWRRTGTFFYCNRIFDVCHRARQFRCCR